MKNDPSGSRTVLPDGCSFSVEHARVRQAWVHTFAGLMANHSRSSFVDGFIKELQPELRLSSSGMDSRERAFLILYEQPSCPPTWPYRKLWRACIRQAGLDVGSRTCEWTKAPLAGPRCRRRAVLKGVVRDSFQAEGIPGRPRWSGQ